MYFHFILLFLCVSEFSSAAQYPWCDFDGEIPLNAIVAGQKSDGSDIYVIQAYLPYAGLVVGEITSNFTEIYVQFKGIRRVTENIKILCSNETNFAWLETSGNTWQSDLAEKRPVIGGLQEESEVLYVARMLYQDETYIGKVVAYYGPYSGVFFGVDKNMKEILEGRTYEILLYTG